MNVVLKFIIFITMLLNNNPCSLFAVVHAQPNIPSSYIGNMSEDNDDDTIPVGMKALKL